LQPNYLGQECNPNISESSPAPHSIAIGIVAHIDRLTQTNALAHQVEAAHIAIDDGTLGCEGNHHRVWKHLAHSGAYWTVVLEDDAEPVPFFGAQLTSALAMAPASIVSLYLGRSRPPQWQKRIERATYGANAANASFILHNRLLHCVGVAIKSRLVGEMLDTVAMTACHGLPMDEAISAWARAHRYGVAYTWPSLVDHEDGPTLAIHRDGVVRDAPRRAWKTGTRTRWGTTHVAM
jgi:hypothetical protein